MRRSGASARSLIRLLALRSRHALSGTARSPTATPNPPSTRRRSGGIPSPPSLMRPAYAVGRARRLRVAYPAQSVTQETDELRPLGGKVALVAGATRGAGRGTAVALGEAGAPGRTTGARPRAPPSEHDGP